MPFVVGIVLALSATTALADDLDFDQGFADLNSHLGGMMGKPLTPEQPDPNGSGDTIQLTTTGLARYKTGAMPAFFDGETRFTWFPDRGKVEWHGDSWTPPPPEPQQVAASVPSGGVWLLIKNCETPNLGWNANTGNGFYGGLQFDYGTWIANGGGDYAPTANLATPAQQISVAETLHAKRGYAPWPACRARLKLP